MRFLCCFLTTCFFPLLLNAAPKTPHFVVFLSDGHGQADSSVYGSTTILTPQMQRLAADGMTFTRAYSGSPSSVPARAVLMTGLMPSRNGAVANITGIAGDVTTLPAQLTRAGYRCVRFGMDDLQPPTSYRSFEAIPSEHLGEKKPVLAAEAVATFLRELPADDPRPLFLLISSRRPAAPWPARSQYDPAAIVLPPTQVDTSETRAFRARYHSDISLMDAELGEVYDAVRAHLGDQALFLYTSTHGPQFPFAKSTLYDAGIRVPMIAVWPGVIPAAARNPALLSHADIAPTFIELAKARTLPDLDGRSFAKLLRKKGGSSHRDAIFATHTGDGANNVYPIRAFRDESFKFILNLHPEFLHSTSIDLGSPDDGTTFWKSWVALATVDPAAAAVVQYYRARPEAELYDLRSDPHETINLAALPEHRALVTKMRSRLNAWMVGQGDRRTVVGEARLIQRATAVEVPDPNAGIPAP